MVGGLSGLLLLGTSLLWSQRWQQKGDRAKQELTRFFRYLAKHQLQPNAGETLSAFIKRAYKQEVKLKPELIKFKEAYYRLRFEANIDKKTEQRLLTRAINNLGRP